MTKKAYKMYKELIGRRFLFLGFGDEYKEEIVRMTDTNWTNKDNISASFEPVNNGGFTLVSNLEYMDDFILLPRSLWDIWFY